MRSGFLHIAALLVTAAGLAASSAAQGTPVAPITPPRPPFQVMLAVPQLPAVEMGNERYIQVDKSVNVALCVNQGTVSINGWNRSEARVFVDEGTPVGFKVTEKSPNSNLPVWIQIVGVSGKNRVPVSSDCLSGNEIQIDVPVNATVTLKGREIDTKVDSIRRFSGQTVGGDMTLRNITNGVTVSAGQGDITLAESSGPVSLDTTTGNIVVFEAGPSEIGDVFKAKTQAGAISLQRIGHRQIDVNSISGSILYNGEVRNGGSYTLSTSNGSIRVGVPETTSCQVVATFGNGVFNSQLPFKTATENVSEGPVKSIVGTLGKGGEATVRLSSTNGSILIRKQQP